VIAFFDPDDVIARHGLGRAPQSLDEMQAAISTLLENVAEWQVTSERCRAHVESYGDENGMAAPYVETFLSLQAASRAARSSAARAGI
jgi:hypothetical protein